MTESNETRIEGNAVPEASKTGYRVGEPHPVDIEQRIREELAQAAALDDAAREHRKAAGRLLAQARGEHPTGATWFAGLDMRSAELLIELGCAAKPAGHPR
ncbi:MAG: hypothetical protein ACYC9L_15930 [Sulfuricaulis sp.]